MHTNEGSLEQTNDQVLNEAEQLIWALLDDTIQESDARRLEELLQDNLQVRTRYLDCIQLHSNLVQHFAQHSDTGSGDTPQSPVLGSLGDIPLGSDSTPWPPVAE
ncbi:MAG: hypothetical protein MI725_05420 [Pirellulales bacterium]|nr:hypothetical protein [Pirellulales bacterium]